MRAEEVQSIPGEQRCPEPVSPGRPDGPAMLPYRAAARCCQRGVIQRVTKDTRVRFPPAHLVTGRTAADK